MLNGLQAGSMHPTFRNERSRPFFIGAGPMFGFSRGDQLHGSLRVQFSPDPIDPTETYQFVQHFPTGHIFIRDSFLVRYQPNALGLLVIFQQPGS